MSNPVLLTGWASAWGRGTKRYVVHKVHFVHKVHSAGIALTAALGRRTKRCFATALALLIGLLTASAARADTVTAPVQVYGLGLVDAVAYSPDGTKVLLGHNRLASLYDAVTGAKIRIFSGHTNVVSSVAFSPDGAQVLTGSWDGTALLWNAVPASQPGSATLMATASLMPRTCNW